jgi:hypothetical protein
MYIDWEKVIAWIYQKIHMIGGYVYKIYFTLFFSSNDGIELCPNWPSSYYCLEPTGKEANMAGETDSEKARKRTEGSDKLL